MVLMRHIQWPEAKVLFFDDQLLVPAVSEYVCHDAVPCRVVLLCGIIRSTCDWLTQFRTTRHAKRCCRSQIDSSKNSIMLNGRGRACLLDGSCHPALDVMLATVVSQFGVLQTGVAK